ncbi:MAG: Rieske 2Fe-2S domain-containing protein [Actinobacteria bacterium]|jgi:3-phenylpropionate/trans-cinnamate dioxygenase ferredoxin subunit|uniref:Unannotated protein n=1 Tax=freshwater metagenome TaxID=449393 RepID=A0A6J6F1P5_9ZZZZ|nr:Rieske 2Fe-2S domain-containing protein [Actinomycetota bacterium]
MTWHRVALLEELEIDKPISVDVDGEPVLVVKTMDGLFAVSDVCSHAEVSLAEGTVAGGKVECWLHGAQFDLASGAALCLPATKAIGAYSVRVSQELQNKTVEVSLERQES